MEMEKGTLSTQSWRWIIERAMGRGGRDFKRKRMASIHRIRHGSSLATDITDPDSQSTSMHYAPSLIRRSDFETT